MKICIHFLTGVAFLTGCSSPDQWSVWQDPLPQPQEISVTKEDVTLTSVPRRELPPLVTQGQVLSLSLEETIFAALGRNRELRMQRLNPIIAGAFEQIERGIYQPELFGTLQASEEQVSETARATGEQFSVKGRDTQATIGARQLLPTGTDVELVLEQDRSISSRTPEQEAARVGLGITQSLLRGFGPTVNLASVRQAKLDTLASRYQLRGYTESFVAEVEIAYWNYVLAQEEMRIFQRSLEFARLEANEVEERIDVGKLSRTEGAITRGEVARRESALVDARADLEERRLRLARLLNVETNEIVEFELITTSEPTVVAEPQNQIDARIALALENRSDLNEAKLRLEQDRLQTIVTRNGLLPQLDLFMTLGKTGYADTFLDSFENLQDDNYDATAGLRFNQFLGDTAAKGRDLLARATREQSAEAVLNHEQLVRLDVQLASNELERARQQIELTKEIRMHQDQTVQGEVERFEVGSSTALQVAQVRRDQLASRIQEVEALIYYHIAQVELYLAEGSLLERRGISIP